MSLLDRLVHRETGDERELSKAERRVRVIPQHELVGYAGTCLNAVAMAMRQIEVDPHGPGVDEALISADALTAVLVEMKRRTASAV